MLPFQSIALINCYLGKLPWYFDYFAHSCKYNPTIDFYIFTDDDSYQKPLPGNVKFIHRTLEEITFLASDKLGLQACINRGYKLCDFKPAYGEIFSEWLHSYDFWGHTDVDIIFGDIRKFITDDVLLTYDIVSVRPDWLTGCFLLYRNQPHVNKLFTHSRDYQKVYTSPEHYCFDETNFAHDAFSDGLSYLDVHTEIESMMHVVSKLQSEGKLKVYYDLHIIEGLPGKLKWIDGKMFYRNRYEVMFYHLIYLKKKYKPKNVRSIPKSFAVSPTKIYPVRSAQQTHGI
ncbi:MAG TPA: DUF6625 family protein [Mucilaginibacter sp.]|nr:DUF6625 family protein [Mucilaginibacter sp.]